MTYFVLLAGYGEMPGWDELTAEEQEAGMAKHVAFDEACAARPGVEMLSQAALGDGSMATTLRTRGGEMTTTDGPFAEAAEQIGGYYLLDAPDLDTVIELCKVLPAYDIDIRPVLDEPDGVVEAVFRAEWGRLLARLVARTRRLDLAEDALGEAFARAADRWPSHGVPDNPAGWLYTTAYRQVVGRLRAEATAGRKAPLLAVRPGWVPPDDDQEAWADDRLPLILLCCHPALPVGSRSALALRLVIGTSTEQIARLFLVPTPTMAARLTRAKKKIVLVGIPLGAPPAEELTSRLDEVCRTIYLAFTAGYTPGAGADLLRADLAGDAVRLAALLFDLVPDAPQVRATLALLLLQHSRRDARLQDGHLVTLADQDRSLWRPEELRAGLELADGLQPDEGYAEELRLQALIAAEHVWALTAAVTDWPVIADHYADLEARTGSAIVRLNRAVAVAEVDGPRAGLALLVALDEALRDNHRLAAVRAELARRDGDAELARASYRTAIGLCANEVERAHLTAQLDAVS